MTCFIYNIRNIHVITRFPLKLDLFYGIGIWNILFSMHMKPEKFAQKWPVLFLNLASSSLEFKKAETKLYYGPTWQ